MLCLSQHSFDQNFMDGALRVDFVLAGDYQSSVLFLDEVRREASWGGARIKLIDPFKYGEYKFNILDELSGQIIFSRGFCTLFEEWQTTSEAKTTKRAFDQVITFPEPQKPVILEIFERDEENVFQTKFRLRIDPSDPYIREGLNPGYSYRKLVDKGNPSEKLDIVFLAEGYTAAETEKFYEDVSRFYLSLSAVEPYNKLQSRLNIWAVASVSEESGTDLPAQSIWENTVINSNFYTFTCDRYLTTEDIKSVRDIAGIVPYDVICILVNTDKYGGGGIYNHYAMVSSDGPMADFVFIHELGHALAGLGDEYYSSFVAYEDFYDLDLEPWQPNLTTLVDFDVKWKDLIHDTVPAPTPSTKGYSEIVGLFEGGGYSATGIYRPGFECRMKSNETDKFCEVCKNTIEKMIYYYCGE
ncbi:M64 family metallopeptidase [Bacteroidota bacterium]